ncbi:hypothetical protein CGW93_02685 [candidate division bacterium WOR-3 4484_18]|uniref:DUF192 domain-containing protein n=1 Tax=candidate division WOR-3 bacterium 4484_18 TaxID=2020626 RepID=A0A257LTR4_UNCW3|nr:MAG: hypothetical protein CGW93_02685 [candidate division bacterium WOR-3 4484_18]
MKVVNTAAAMYVIMMRYRFIVVLLAIVIMAVSFIILARTPEARQLGLMYRQQLPEDMGMLFVFDTVGIYPFWMKNTHIPLSIAFISADGRVVDIQNMEPLSLTLHFPSQPIRFALEVNRSWFTRHGVKVGDTVYISGINLGVRF